MEPNLEGFTFIPLNQRFSYTVKDKAEMKDEKYWSHKYSPEWAWPENLRVQEEVSIDNPPVED